ncbi:hypothetical protein GCM10011512_16680 [Tersicoccus solisilvae]|uniref:DNA-directed DNA polymerase n=1 Tax=Tersicoccus solisilvae TaxID=1882339 RepID=A0ABQ1P3K3_9MICC|nr:DNA polymerase III subunit gamma and tau [Tersicoccus solisilvae]GGC90409.1 hypothetical protein GCM10011512_16680 [Tersicoccus solisilvae]
MSTALYRRYRPETFADVIGQEHVTEPLMTALRKNRVNHAYLFSGPRGCGKTTSARILARCLNCAQGPTDTPCGVCDSCRELARDGSGSLDVIEIDAASHGGVDDARDLRERATFAPVRDRYKVFIIDEAHMVTSAGFNALLKIVEEPPEHILFIFATTEPDKVIGTIRSRTHHYPFHLVPPEPLLAYLERLCAEENVPVAPGVLSLVIRAGGGSVRDTLSVLDQLMAGAGDEGLSYEMAIDLLGYTHASLLDDVVDSLSAGDASTVFGAVDRVIQTGHDPRRFVEDLLERFRDLIIVGAMEESARHVLRAVPEDAIARMQHQARQLGRAELSRAADITNAALTEMTGATSPRLHLELLCARLLLPGADVGERGVAARVDRIERRLNYAAPDAGRGPASAISGAVEGGTGHVGLTPAAGAPAAAATDGARPATTDADSRPDSRQGGARGDGARGDGARGDAPRDDRPAEPAAARPAPARPAPARPAPARPAPETAAPTHAEDRRDAAAAADEATPDAAAAAPVQNAEQGLARPSAEDDAAAESPETTKSAAEDSESADPAVPVDDRDVPTDHDESPVAAAPVAADDLPEPPASRRPGGNAAADDEATDAGSSPQRGAPAESSGSDVDMVRRAWPEVLEALGRAKKVAWILVSQNGTVRALRDNTLYLEFPTPGIADQFGRHEDHVREALGAVLGLQVRVVAVHPGSAPPSGGTATDENVAGGGRPKAPTESAGRVPRPAGSSRPSPQEAAARPTGPTNPDDQTNRRAPRPESAPSADRPATTTSSAATAPAAANPRERVWSPSGPTAAPTTPAGPPPAAPGRDSSAEPARPRAAEQPARAVPAGAPEPSAPTAVSAAPSPSSSPASRGSAHDGAATAPWDDEPPLPDEPDPEEPPFPDDEDPGRRPGAPGRGPSPAPERQYRTRERPESSSRTARPAPTNGQAAEGDRPARPAPGAAPSEPPVRPARGTDGPSAAPPAPSEAPARPGAPATGTHAASDAPPSAPAAVPTPMEDIPSEDDQVLEDSGRAGRAAAERILGAQLIDERELLRD